MYTFIGQSQFKKNRLLFFSAQINHFHSVSDSCTLLPPVSLVFVYLCTSKSCYCLPLCATYVCLLSVETKETDHKAYYGARS